MTQEVLGLRVRQQQRSLLEVSMTAVDLFVERGFGSTTVEEITRAAGVSRRTFHRYFPTKEDSAAPVLDQGWNFYLEEFAARPPHEPVADSVLLALEAALNSEHGRRYRAFLRSLPDSPALEPIWLRTSARCQQALEPLLVLRLGLRISDPRTAFTAACITSATRIGVETWPRASRRSVLDTTRQCLDMIDEALLDPVG